MLNLTLNQDCTVTSTSQIAPQVISIQLNSSGQIPAATQIWANDEIQPSGSFYSLEVYTSGVSSALRVYGFERMAIIGNSPINLNAIVPGTGTGGTTPPNNVVITGIPDAGDIIVATGPTGAIWQDNTANAPGGSNTQFQYNNIGAFGGALNFTYDGTSAIFQNFASFVTQGSVPPNPSSGFVRLFSKTSDNKLYYVDSTGTVTGPLSSGGGGGGTPGGSNFQFQYNNAGSFAGTNVFTDGNSLFAKGPIPYHDITAYEGVPGTTCFSAETVTGSISSGSHTLSVSGGTWVNGCYVGIANAGSPTSLASPSIASVVFTPATMQATANGFTRTSNVVTVTLTNDASIAVGDTIVVSGATGCAHSPNGTFTVASTNWVAGANNANGNTFTYNQTAGNDSACGGDNGDGTGPATIIVQTGTSHYSYKVAAMDYNNGLTAPTVATTVTNSVPTLQGMEPNVVTINCTPGAASYPIWRQTGGVGNFIYIGSALPCPTGYTRTTTTLTDYGQTFGAGTIPQIPVGVPINAPSTALGQIFVSQITAGGGTSNLTLATPASSTVSSTTTYHDNTTSFNAALSDARTNLGGGVVYIPSTVLARFCNIDLTTVPVSADVVHDSSVLIRVDGGLWSNCTVHRVRGEYKIIGTGNWAGNSNFNQTLSNALWVTGDLNPTLFDESNQGVLQGFSFGLSPNTGIGYTGNEVGLTAYTAVYIANQTDNIYSDLATGGNANAISPGLVVDGCSGVGGNFGMSFTNMNWVGSVNFPVPAAAFHCVGASNFNNIFQGQRHILFDYTTTGDGAGGGITFNSSQGYMGSEAVHSPTLIVTNFQNSSNGGMEFHGITPADPLYGGNGLIQDVTPGGQNGSVSIYGTQFSGFLVVGQPFNSALFANIGESGLGAQSKGIYQVVGTGVAAFGNGNGITAQSLNVRSGGVTIGKTFASLTNFPGLYMVDQTSGGTGMSASTLGNAGNNVLWVDSNDPSSSAVYFTGNNSAASRLFFQTPNTLTNGEFSVFHGATNLLRIGMSGQNVNLWGAASGNFLTGDLSIPNRLGFASGSNPMFLTGAPTAVRTFTYPDASGIVGIATGSITTGHVAQFNISGGVTTLVDGGSVASNPMTTAGDIIYGGTGGTPTRLAAGTANQVLHSGTVPSWGAVSLTADVSGITPVANGGTGLASGTSGGILCYTAAGTLASSAALTADGILYGGGAGVCPSSTGAGTAGQVLTSNGAGVAPTFQAAGSGVTSFSAGNLSPLFTTSVATATTTPALTFALSNASAGTVFGNNAGSSTAPAFVATPVLGLPGTTLGTIGLAGNTSGTVTIQPQAAAGTYNLNLPTTAGSSGQYLTSAGGGSSAMTWTTAGVVNSGTANQLAYYATSTNAVSGLSLPADTQTYVLTGSSTSTPAWSLPGVPIDAQTGGSPYAWPSADRNELLTITNGSAFSVTIAQANSTGFTNNFHSALFNLGNGLVTITPSTSQINGASTQIVPKNWVGYLYSDNTNYLMPVLPSLNAFPSCTDTGGNHLNINTATGAITCGTTSNPTVSASTIGTTTNCSSSASPAVCSAAAAGSVVIAAGATTVQVNTSAVTTNSQIFVFPDETLGTKLGVTCNSTLATSASGLAITARSAGTSFTVSTTATVAVNPVCLSYLVVN